MTASSYFLIASYKELKVVLSLIPASKTTLLLKKWRERQIGGDHTSTMGLCSLWQGDFVPSATTGTASSRQFEGDAQPTHPLTNPHWRHSAPDLCYGTILFAKKLVPCVAFAIRQLFHLPRTAANCDFYSNKRLHRPLPKPADDPRLNHPRSIPARFSLPDTFKHQIFHGFSHLSNSTCTPWDQNILIVVTMKRTL